MTYKRMYYLVSIDKRREYCRTYYQQNKGRYEQIYEEQKPKLKEKGLSVESNEHNKPLSAISKLYFQTIYLFICLTFMIKCKL